MEDHCTLFWDVWNDTDISGCCLVHDEDYENGLVSRKEADQHLRD